MATDSRGALGRPDANHRDQVTAAYLDGRYFACTRSLSRDGAVPLTSALAPCPLARGIPLLPVQAAVSGVRTVETVGVPGSELRGSP